MAATFRRPLAPTVAVCALVLAAAGVGLAIDARHHADRAQQQLVQSRQHGKNAVALLATAEVELCARVYSQLTLIEQLSARQETPEFYRHILPDIPLRTVRRLLANARRQTRLVLAELSPRHCSSLAAQQLVTP